MEKRKYFVSFFENWGRIAAILLVIIGVSFFVPRFFSYPNLINLIRHVFLLCLISYGVALSMLIEGLDLSVGSVAALSCVIAATFIAKGDVAVGISVGLIVGALCGFGNGLLIAKLKVPDFIVTFSMMFIARGLAMTYTQGLSIYGYPKTFSWLGKSYIGPIPTPAIISALIFALVFFLLYKTTFGRTTYAVGVNKEAARFSGISVSKNIITVYTLAGVFAAIAGLIFIARLSSADANLGMEWPLEAIAVCVIGGIGFSGGEGNLFGVILGAIVIAVISNCINLLAMPSRFQDIFLGFMIVSTVGINNLVKRRAR